MLLLNFKFWFVLSLFIFSIRLIRDGLINDYLFYIVNLITLISFWKDYFIKKKESDEKNKMN